MLSPDISANVKEFSIKLQSSLPLKHHWEYVEADTFNVKACVESSVAFQKLRNNVLITATGQEKGEFAETFRLEVGKLIEAHRMKNEDLKNQAFLVLKKRREDLCADFKSTIERNSNIDLKSTEELLKAGMEQGRRYFEYHSKFGNDNAYNKKRIREEKVLMQELDKIGKVLLGRRRGNLRSGSEQEGRKLLEEEISSLLKKRMEELCEDFKSTVKTKLLIAPDMDSESLKELMGTGKDLAKGYFEYHSDFGNTGRYNEDQMKEQELEQQLKKLESEMLNEHRRHLKSISEQEAKKLLEKLKESVLEMAEQVKADSHKWTMKKRELNLKERIDGIRNFVNENCGGVLSEDNNRKIFAELMRLEAGEKLSSDKFIECAEGLATEVKHDIECDMETPEMHFLDLAEDAPKVEGTIEFNLGRKTIKQEVVEREGQCSTLDIPHELDIDIKLELDGLVLHRSCQKPKQAHSPNPEHGIGNFSASEDVRTSSQQNLIKTETAEKFEAVDAKNVSNSKNKDSQTGDLVMMHSGEKGDRKEMTVGVKRDRQTDFGTRSGRDISPCAKKSRKISSEMADHTVNSSVNDSNLYDGDFRNILPPKILKFDSFQINLRPSDRPRHYYDELLGALCKTTKNSFDSYMDEDDLLLKRVRDYRTRSSCDDSHAVNLNFQVADERQVLKNLLVSLKDGSGYRFFPRELNVYLSEEEMEIVKGRGKLMDEFNGDIAALLQGVGDQIWHFGFFLEELNTLKLSFTEVYILLHKWTSLMPNLKWLEVLIHPRFQMIEEKRHGSRREEMAKAESALQTYPFPHLPHLERLSLHSSFQRGTGKFLNIYGIIIEANQHIQMLDLNEARFMNHNISDLAGIRPMININCKLLKMHLTLSGKADDSILSAFQLLKQFPTLEEVKLKWPSNFAVQDTDKIGYLELPNLREFDMELTAPRIDYHSNIHFFFSLQFLVHCKKLTNFSWMLSGFNESELRELQGHLLRTKKSENCSEMADFTGGFRYLYDSNIWQIFLSLDKLDVMFKIDSGRCCAHTFARKDIERMLIEQPWKKDLMFWRLSHSCILHYYCFVDYELAYEPTT